MASYEKKENGTWSVRFRAFVDGVEKNKRLSGFKSKKAAEIAYGEYLTHEITPKKPTEDITFKQLAEAYFHAQQSRVKASTMYDVQDRVNKNIIPYFGEKNVVDIMPIDILNWQNGINDKFAYSYKSNLYGYLATIFHFGNRYYNLPVPTDKVDNFRNLEPKKEMQIWTVEQFRHFTAFVKNPTMLVLFSVLFYGGLRKGEAFALTWRDYNFTTHKLSITKSITRKVKGKAWAVTTPKNLHSFRTILVPTVLHDALCSIPKGKPNEFIFGGNRPLPQTTVERYFKNYTKAADLPIIRIHDLRHSCASHLLSNADGVNLSPIAVAKYLGHTVEMLLKTYAHMLPNDDLRIANKFS